MASLQARYIRRKTNKYNAKKTSVDGVVFDSALESKVYIILKANGLSPELQKEFVLQDGFRFDGEYIRPILYRSDFVITHSGNTYILDAKGMVLPESKLKAKLMLKLGHVVIYLKSAKKAQQFCEMLFSGKPPSEMRKVFNKN